MMNTPESFISCDWGTTNFRLRLVDYESLNVLQQIESSHGIKMHHSHYLTSGATSREDYYGQYIITQVKKLAAQHHHDPIVLSGMASSTIGMKDLPYADFPIKADGSSLTHEQIQLSTDQNIILVSGVKNDHGMMRGEEVQAVGLSHLLQSYPHCVLILPGTHSKHITSLNGEYTTSKNFMTGERFELLSTKSILSNSVKKGSWNSAAFTRGVRDGANYLLSAKLFSVRASHILSDSAPDQNYCYLSGLLIGDELAYLIEEETLICLAAAKALSEPYQQALHAMNIPKERLHFIAPSAVELALLSGQKKILKSYVSTT